MLATMPRKKILEKKYLREFTPNFERSRRKGQNVWNAGRTTDIDFGFGWIWQVSATERSIG